MRDVYECALLYLGVAPCHPGAEALRPAGDRSHAWSASVQMSKAISTVRVGVSNQFQMSLSS